MVVALKWWLMVSIQLSLAYTDQQYQERTPGLKGGSSSSKTTPDWILILVVFRVTTHPDLLWTGVGGWFPGHQTFSAKTGKVLGNWKPWVILDICLDTSEDAM